jgi:hypothetical protein
MIGTPHMLLGAAAASHANSVKQAFAVGVASHFVLDTIPHTDYPILGLCGAAAVADLIGGAMVTRSMIKDDRVMAAGAFGAVVPDFVAFAERTVRVRLTRIFHEAIHTDVDPRLWVGIATQVATGAVGALALHKLAARRRRRAAVSEAGYMTIPGSAVVELPRRTSGESDAQQAAA